VTNLGITNTGTLPVQADVSLSKVVGLGLTLSSDVVTLSPGSSQIVQVSVNPLAGLPAGLYPVTLNISATQEGGPPVTRSLYMSLLVGNSLTVSPLAYSLLTMQPSSNTVSATLAIANPRNRTLYNVSVTARLPADAARSVHDIALSGASGTVAEENNSYVLTWYLPYISSAADAYLFYKISNVSSALPFAATSLSFSIPSQQSQGGRLAILGLHAPTMYTNQAGHVSVEALYTGSSGGDVTFTLAAPPSIAVLNASQTYLGYTNEIIDVDFTVPSIGAAGTYLMTLYVSGAGVNQTYYLPVIVESGASAAAGPEMSQLYLVAEGAIAAAALLAAAGIALRIRARPRYSSERARKLKDLNEQLKKEL
jgi:hypothetical protein